MHGEFCFGSAVVDGDAIIFTWYCTSYKIQGGRGMRRTVVPKAQFLSSISWLANNYQNIIVCVLCYSIALNFIHETRNNCKLTGDLIAFDYLSIGVKQRKC